MRKLHRITIVCLLWFSIAIPNVGGTTLYSGSVTDPAGDGHEVGFDFISGTATVTETNLIFETTFSPSFNWGQAVISVSIDIDQNAATGYPGVSAAEYNKANFGGDYRINWGGDPDYFHRFTDSSGSLLGRLGHEYSASASGDFANVIIPLGLFGGVLVDEFNFVFTIQRVTHSDGYDASTGILDFMPGTLSFGTTAPVPEPGTMMLLGFGILGIAGVSRRKK